MNIYFEHVSEFYFWQKLYFQMKMETMKKEIVINKDALNDSVLKDELKNFSDTKIIYSEPEVFLRNFKQIDFKNGRFDFVKNLETDSFEFLGFNKEGGSINLYVNNKRFTIGRKSNITFSRKILEEEKEYRIYEFQILNDDEIKYRIKYRLNFIEGWVLQAYIELEQKMEEDDIFFKFLNTENQRLK